MKRCEGKNDKVYVQSADDNDMSVRICLRHPGYDICLEDRVYGDLRNRHHKEKKMKFGKKETKPIVFEVQQDYDEERHGLHLIKDGIEQIQRDLVTGAITESKAKKDLKLIYQSVIRLEEKGIFKAFQLLDSDITEEQKQEIRDYLDELRSLPEWKDRVDIIGDTYNAHKDMESL